MPAAEPSRLSQEAAAEGAAEVAVQFTSTLLPAGTRVIFAGALGLGADRCTPKGCCTNPHLLKAWVLKGVRHQFASVGTTAHDFTIPMTPAMSCTLPTSCIRLSSR